MRRFVVSLLETGAEAHMQRPAGRHNTLEDYFAVEESSAIKHEYLDGEIYAMAGASLRHNRITRNVLTSLTQRLRGANCEAFSADLRLRTPGGLLTYPDVMVICGQVMLSAVDRLDTVLNPVVIVEVLSESTRDYDQGEKSRLYREITTLRDYLLVEQSRIQVEHRWIDDADKHPERGSWTTRQHSSTRESIALFGLGIELPIAEVHGDECSEAPSEPESNSTG